MLLRLLCMMIDALRCAGAAYVLNDNDFHFMGSVPKHPLFHPHLFHVLCDIPNLTNNSSRSWELTALKITLID